MASKKSAQSLPQSLYLPGFDPYSLFDDEPCAPVAQAVSPQISLLSDGAPAKPRLVDLIPTPQESAEVVGSAFDQSVVAPIDVSVDVEAEESDASTARRLPAIEPVTPVLAFDARQIAPWSRLPLDLHDDLGGLVGKFDANIDAIELLQEIERERRAPDDRERHTLSRYVGWGGLPQVFEGYQEWRHRHDLLRRLIGPEAFNSAAVSTINAHFTELRIVDAMWRVVQGLGFKGGRVLDPSAGTGHFFGAMPEDLARACDLHAVEIDGVSARIHRALYGMAANTQHCGFEKTEFAEASFDLAISNVPFGDYTVGCTRRRPYSRLSIHNYFIGRMLDLVRPGGIVAVITSSFFLESKDTAFREWVQTQAELIGAMRLPAGAFTRIANTEVACDMVFLRRRHADEFPSDTEQAWTERVTLPASHVEGVSYEQQRLANEYWLNNPRNVIGRWQAVTRHHTNGLVPQLPREEIMPRLNQAVEAFPRDTWRPRRQSKAIAASPALGSKEPLEPGLKPGSHVIRHGVVHRVNSDGLERLEVKGTKESRMRGLIAIRDLARSIVAQQLLDKTTESQLIELRAELNRTYDAFVRKHGWVSSRGNAIAFRHDPDWPLLLSLEFYDEKEDVATKAAIFSVRTGQPVAAPTTADSPADAVAISIAETGQVNPSYIAQLLDADKAEVMDQLELDGLVFVNPETGLYEGRSEYLSGNVRKKIVAANAAGDRFKRNVDALTGVLPEDLAPGDIDCRLGVNWVPTEDYEHFIRHLVPAAFATNGASVNVIHDAITGAWSVKSNVSDAELSTKWGTKDISALGILAQVLNGKQVTVKDPVVDEHNNVTYVVNIEKTAAAQEKQALLEETFKCWLWEDHDRARRLVRRYNDEFNSFVERVFDGSKLRLPGYSWALTPAPHQLNVAARIATGDNTLLAHCVGAGKTLEMTIGSMELRRLGLRKKPVHVVPNSLLQQYAAEFLRAYPGANVLIATKDDLAKDRRKEFCARVATGDWDAVVMTHSTFSRVPAGPGMAKAIMSEMLAEVNAALAEMRSDREDRARVKQLAKMRREFEARLERLENERSKDDFVSIDDMGIDQILFDEAHLAKNLVRFSQMERVAGLPNTNSQRAFDLFVKTRQMMRMHGNKQRGVVLATGTFISNSMAEVHVFQRYLQPHTLVEVGLDSFDAWAAQFGRTVTALEVSPDGSSFRINRRFAQFCNLPELTTMLAQFADIKTRSMLNLPTPRLVGGQAQTVACKPSEGLKEFIAGLVKRAEAIRNGLVRPTEDNMLAVTTDGRKAALDLRMVDPAAAFDPNGKVAKCAEMTHRLWEESTPQKGTQIVMCDLGTPSGKSFNVYGTLRARMIELGVPAGEIAFVQDATSDAAKEALFKQVREGKIRVLFGSTETCGTGVNVQTRLYALHHLDAPWRPSDVEQREGRIERRGNLFEEVHIIRYVTEGSFDAFMWQTLAAKARFIDQVMSGDRQVRRVEDASMVALSYEEVKAIACGNPIVKEKAMLDAELRKLSLLSSHHAKSKYNANYALQALSKDEASAIADIAALISDREVAESAGHVVEIGGRIVAEGEALNEALASMMTQVRESPTKGKTMLFRYAGLPVMHKAQDTRYHDKHLPVLVELGERWRQKVFPYMRGVTLIAELREAVERIPEIVARRQDQIASYRRQRPTLELAAAAVFEHGARIQQVQARLRELEIELGLTTDMAGTSAVDEDAVLENRSSVGAEDFEGERSDEEATAD